MQTADRSRSVAHVSGIYTPCIDGSRGNCDVFKSSFRGCEVIYPGLFGALTVGADKNLPIEYSHLDIMSYTLGAKSLPDEALEVSYLKSIEVITIPSDINPATQIYR